MPETRKEEEKVLLEWEAPERSYTKRSKGYFKNLFTLLAILAAVAVFFKEFILAGVLVALGFLKWALGTTPPKVVKHAITDRGIKTHGHEYGWDQLKGFWFDELEEEEVLHVDTTSIYPGRLFLLLGSVNRDKVSEVLREYLSERERIPEGTLERISETLAQKFPLE